MFWNLLSGDNNYFKVDSPVSFFFLFFTQEQMESLFFPIFSFFLILRES